ncbi:MAG: molybdate ABC transporter substrate-binding protein [Candidatus Acidiferrum sp.]
MIPRILPMFLALLIGCGPAIPGGGQPVKLFAAASTRGVISQIADHFSAQTGMKVECSFAASSTLARQIEAGADADLFISADEAWIDYLDKRQLVAMRQPLLTNQLVVVVPTSSHAELHKMGDLINTGIRRLAIAGESVPAGRYARQALAKAGLMRELQMRFIEAKDVTATALYVARGEADAGFVYTTDAAGNDKLHVAFEVPAEMHEAIIYPLAILAREPAKAETAEFMKYLKGARAATLFQSAGFGVTR